VRNGNVLVSIQTEPSVVHVGDNFTIHATLIDYSPFALGVWRNGCAGPLGATFDKNVAIEKGIRFCAAQIMTPTFTIKQVSTPLIAGDLSNPFTEHFKASTAGMTNATLLLEYQIKDPENKTTGLNAGFDRDNATLVSCFQNNEMFSPCSFVLQYYHHNNLLQNTNTDYYK
jgi:hypothetical protein